MSVDDQLAVKVENVSKVFKLPREKSSSVKDKIISIPRRNKGYEVQRALHDISFEVRKGEFYGIVGKNGGGKSTLLKVISGIYEPSHGNVQVNGKLTPFIELGVGFNPELTGRENIFLNGALLGFNRKEMSKMYKDIVAFAELERFMDQKLKNYSSGMQVRLAFSIAIRAKSDILVMDEVLAVGDAAFQKKCFEIFRDLKKQGRTIILVTHDMGNVERFCDRVLVINEGEQMAVTTPGEASSMYARLNISEAQQESTDKKYQVSKNRLGSGKIKVVKAKTFLRGKPANVFNMGDDFGLELDLKRSAGYETAPLTCGLAFFNEDEVNVIGPNSEAVTLQEGATKVTFTLPNLTLTPGEYGITIALYDKDAPENYYDLLDKWVHFSVVTDHITHGLVEINGTWESDK